MGDGWKQKQPPDSPSNLPDSPLDSTCAYGEAEIRKRKAKRSPPRRECGKRSGRPVSPSSRPDSPLSNTDGEAEMPKRKAKRSQPSKWSKHSDRPDGKAQTTIKRKKGKNTFTFYGTDGQDAVAVLHGEETARPKQQRKHSRRDQPSSHHDGEAQEPGQASAAPSRNKKKKRNNRLLHSSLMVQDAKAHLLENGSAYLMPGSNDIVVLPKQKKNSTGLSEPPANHSCSNAQRTRKASVDGEKEKNILMGEEPHKIIRPTRLRGDTIITPEEDGNCLDGDLLMDRSILPTSHSSSTQMQHKEQGAGKTEDLLHLDFEAAIKQVVQYFMQLSPGPPDDEAFWAKYDEPQLFKVYERLALYRIKDHELKLTGKKLDIAQLKRKYRPAILQAESYFRRYEKNLEWCFDPELCQRAILNDYQRLVIHDDGSYANWDYYRLTYHTYEGDAEYVSYCEEMSNAIKWIDDKVGLDKHQWERYKSIAYLQALKIAIGYHNIFRDAVMGGFSEYIASLKFDYDNRKDFDAVYLEIWKRVAKNKMEFVPAVKQIYEENMFPSRNSDIKLAMENRPLKFRASVKDNYDTYVACIDEKTSEDKARPLIIEAVKKMSPKWKKSYLDYARRKMQIAVRIGL